jgi:REP element-mobilizing transposase RayT
MPPLVIAYHIIITTYGFWLSNDPRGSWSDFVGAWELLKYGRATKVTTHRSLAHVPHDRELRRAAKRALKYPPVRFSPAQVRSIAKGFARAISESGYVVHACALMPDHAHLVVARHQRTAERITSHLKSFSTRQLRADGLHPFERFARADGSVPEAWGEGLWKVFLFTPQDVERAIRYVEDNPVRDGFSPQEWDYVVPYVI